MEMEEARREVPSADEVIPETPTSSQHVVIPETPDASQQESSLAFEPSPADEMGLTSALISGGESMVEDPPNHAISTSARCLDERYRAQECAQEEEPSSPTAIPESPPEDNLRASASKRPCFERRFSSHWDMAAAAGSARAKANTNNGGDAIRHHPAEDGAHRSQAQSFQQPAGQRPADFAHSDHAMCTSDTQTLAITGLSLRAISDAATPLKEGQGYPQFRRAEPSPGGEAPHSTPIQTQCFPSAEGTPCHSTRPTQPRSIFDLPAAAPRPPRPSFQAPPAAAVPAAVVADVDAVWRSLSVPAECVSIWQGRGIAAPFDWQAECLGLSCLQSNRNLVYSLPTVNFSSVAHGGGA